MNAESGMILTCGLEYAMMREKYGNILQTR